jgi:hypothetical protein
MTRLAMVLLVVAVFAARLAQAQGGEATDPSATAYLLRLQRASYRQSVCLLLSGDGHYHVERHTPQKVRVFEGNLDAGEFRGVVHILSDDRLYELEQKQIPDLMLKSDNDQVMLDIHRPNSWQLLTFPDSASREPFRDTLDPLLKWFDEVNKRKMRELSEEAGRNNCMPPRRPEFARREEPAQEAAASKPAAADVSPLANYTLQIFDDRVVKDKVEATCLLVSASGAYHLVKESKRIRGLSSTVLDGKLDPAQVASLRGILDAPGIWNEPEAEKGVEVIFTGDSYFTRLAIPRGGKVQRIAAWKSYRIVNRVMSNSKEEHGTKLLAPLREWLKANIDENKAAPSLAPPNPQCSPEE